MPYLLIAKNPGLCRIQSLDDAQKIQIISYATIQNKDFFSDVQPI